MRPQVKINKSVDEFRASTTKGSSMITKKGDIAEVMESQLPEVGSNLMVSIGGIPYNVPFSDEYVSLLSEVMNIKLVSATKDPIETLFAVWYGSRHEDSMTTEQVRAKMSSDLDFLAEVEKTIDQIAASSLPVSEFVTLNFECDEVAIYWYDQLVRTRLQSIWSQTTRNVPLGDYRPFIPSSVKDNSEAYRVWLDHDEFTKKTISKLIDLGIPAEDANRKAPTARTRRAYWSIDFSNLKRVMSSRGCWIAQSDVWLPAVVSLVKAVNEYSPELAKFIGGTPCNFTGKCKYPLENDARYTGKDPHPVCPLYCRSNNIEYPLNDYKDMTEFKIMSNNYSQLWGDRFDKVMGK